MRNKRVNKGNETRIDDLPEIPKVDVAPRGVLNSRREVEESAVDEQDVVQMRDWNEENKL